MTRGVPAISLAAARPRIERACRALRRPQTWISAFASVAAAWSAIDAAWSPDGDVDTWWVAAAGRQMLARGEVPRENLWSYTEPHTPWIMHEWLLGPPYAFGLHYLGPAWFALISLALLCTALALIAKATLGRANRPLAGWLLAAVACLFFLRRFVHARPTGVALLLPLALTLLAFTPRMSRKRLAACVALMWVWTNTHGSFPLGLLLLCAAALEQPRDRPARLWACALGAAVTFVNPYGAHLHLLVLRYLLGRHGIYREIHADIQEFGNLLTAAQGEQPLLRAPDFVGFAIVLGMAFSALRQASVRVRACVCLALLGLAVTQARHLELAGLLSCVLLVPWADAWVARLPALTPGQAAAPDVQFRRQALARLLAPAYVLGALALAVALWMRTPADFIDERRDLLPALSRVPDGSNLLVSFPYAGMATWYGLPRGIRVFFDSRNDCYHARTAELLVEVGDPSTPASRVSAILDATRTDSVIVARRAALSRKLTRARGWRRDAAGPLYVFLREPSRAHSTARSGTPRSLPGPAR